MVTHAFAQDEQAELMQRLRQRMRQPTQKSRILRQTLMRLPRMPQRRRPKPQQVQQVPKVLLSQQPKPEPLRQVRRGAIRSDAEKAMREMQEADATYRAKIGGLEEKVNELKESIFRSKAKLMMLTEQVTGGLSTSARVLLLHENQMGSGFALVQRHSF